MPGAGKTPTPLAKKRLAIIGNGMATCRLLDELLARGATGRWDITVYGEEPGGTYNRVLLSKVLGGEAPDEIVTKDAAWFEANGIRLRSGVTVKRLDTSRKVVETTAGHFDRYDAAVFATGSQPLVPAIEGATVAGGELRPGVFVYRTMADCLAMREHARGASSAIVLGGGLLGLEAAKVLGDAGLHVTVVHARETLMNAQLDPMAGEMLARHRSAVDRGDRMTEVRDHHIRRLVAAHAAEQRLDGAPGAQTHNQAVGAELHGVLQLVDHRQRDGSAVGAGDERLT